MPGAEPVVLLVELTIREGRIDRFLEAAQEHARITLAGEPGCLQFDVVREDATHVVFYEVYRDAAAVAAHRSGTQYERFRSLIADWVTDRRLRELSRASDGRPQAKGRILIAPTYLAERRELLGRLTEAGYELVFNETGRLLDAAGLSALLPGVVATIAGSEPYDERTLSAGPELRVVARMGVGHDQVDAAAATRHGVAVAMAYGVNHDAVADHAFALMGALASSLMAHDRRVREGGWGPVPRGRLHGATVGLIGFGRIGRAMAKRCQGFAMPLLVHDPFVEPAALAHLGCTAAGLDQLLAEADFVSLHAPATAATRHMIDARALSLMRSSAYLINTARGALVDEVALVAALEAGAIAGAGLDVFETEPLPEGSRLRELDKVLLSPHVAGMHEWSLRATVERCVESILTHLGGRGLDPGLVLNPEALAQGGG